MDDIAKNWFLHILFVVVVIPIRYLSPYKVIVRCGSIGAVLIWQNMVLNGFNEIIGL